MRLKNYNVYFFMAVLAGVSVMAYFIVRPFLIPFLLAVILAHLFDPAYRLILKIMRNRGLSSITTCALVLLIIIAPIVIVSSLVVEEVQVLIDRFNDNPDLLEEMARRVSDSVSAFLPAVSLDLDRMISQESAVSFAKNSSQWIISILQSTYQGVAHFVFMAFIMFFSLFYLLIDGKALLKRVMALSPISDRYEDILADKFNSITRATIKGTLLIAILQGLLGGILFYFSNVTSPVFLGILMTVSSVVPSVGAGLVWLPAGLVMLALGHVAQGIAILIGGALVISTIDNLVRPKLVGRDTEMHPLAILFSTLGGIALFGFAGFIAGPVIMALFIALWDIYALEFKAQLKEFNG